MEKDLEYEEFINCIFQEYLKRKQHTNLLTRDINLFKNIITLYFQKDRTNYFADIIDNFKDLYILDESRIEPHVTKEEQLGLGIVYDYIKDFDFEKDNFNIFVISLIIHSKLYSKCAGSDFGGKLRNTNVSLKDLDIYIPDPDIAIKLFNSYLDQKNSDQIFLNYFQSDLFGYLDNCIKLCVTLIKIQPFYDGNKRCFRALLNLLFKRVNIPPIFINLDERKEYKNALIKALKDEDYSDIIKFYYYKICDAIILLDIENSKNQENNKFQKKIAPNLSIKC